MNAPFRPPSARPFSLETLDRYDARPNDNCTPAGARRLAETIRAAWKKHGHDVEIIIEAQGFERSLRSGHAVIRSDLVNGLPRALAERRTRRPRPGAQPAKGI